MLKYKRFLTAGITMLVSVLTLHAQSESNFTIAQNRDGTVTITGYKGSAKNVIIPETLSGRRVTHIGDEAFADSWLTSITIPHSVKEIGYQAFYGNRLTSITIGAGVDLDNFVIGNDSFNIVYRANRQAAGTYTRPTPDSPTWTRR